MKKLNPIGKIKTTQIPGSPGGLGVAPAKKSNGIKLDYVPFGDDNMFPQAVEYLNRKSGAHRGIIMSKIQFYTGKGFSFPDGDEELAYLVDQINSYEDMRTLARKYFRDHESGNAYLQIIKGGDQITLHHVDHTLCREGDNDFEGQVLIHPDWKNYQNRKKDRIAIAKYPNFTEIDGLQYSMWHEKDYEPEFKHYGVPNWIAGLNASAIAYKTNQWNVSRLDNGYRISGILLVDGEFSSKEAEQKFDRDMDAVYTDENNRGKLLKVKKTQEGDNTKLIPFPQNEDADWVNLHNQSQEELLIAHQWKPALAGFNTRDGFSDTRILSEYKVVKSGPISDAQEKFLNIIKTIYWEQMGVDCSELRFINDPPVDEIPDTLMVWEDRKNRGLEYDENDPKQRLFISELRAVRTINEQLHNQSGG